MKNIKKLSTILIILFLIITPVISFAQGGNTEPRDEERLVSCDGPDCNFSHLLIMINDIIDFFIKISIPIAMILFAWAGFLYITAAGNTGKIEKAHNIFKDVLVGFLIVISAWLIVNTIVSPLISDDFETLLEKPNIIENNE